MENYIFKSNSENDTKEFAKKFASKLKKGDVIVLSGELGSGKTKFTEGFLSYFGLENEISSPTFTIVNEYNKNDINIYHFDVYRLEDTSEFYAIGGEEYFEKGICIIEWGELIKEALPKKYIKIDFSRSSDNENSRILNIQFKRKTLKIYERSFILKILCIDTSSNLCSVAILENTTLINKLELNNGLTHSETLMPLIKKILNNSKISLKDIDLLAVDIGPGSFTGLRIGIATVKAFSDSLNIPCIGISSLEILAYNIKKDGIICSTIDCKNNNCYFALYELNSNNYTILEEPQANSIENIINLINSKYANKSINYVGNGIKNETNSNYLDIENLGIAAFKKFNNNCINKNILPLYLKKPQAQQQLEEKMKILNK